MLTVDVGDAILSPSEAGVVGPFRLKSTVVAVSLKLKLESGDIEVLFVGPILWSSSPSSGPSSDSPSSSSSLSSPSGNAMTSSVGSRMPASLQKVSKQVYPGASVNVATLLCRERGILRRLFPASFPNKTHSLPSVCSPHFPRSQRVAVWVCA